MPAHVTTNGLPNTSVRDRAVAAEAVAKPTVITAREKLADLHLEVYKKRQAADAAAERAKEQARLTNINRATAERKRKQALRDFEWQEQMVDGILDRYSLTSDERRRVNEILLHTDRIHDCDFAEVTCMRVVGARQ
jgi:hypothetical protein